MRAGAQVFEVAVPIGGDSFVRRNFGDNLELQRLVGVQRQRLLARVFAVFECQVLGDDRAHSALDPLNVFVAEGLRR